jgi:predicted nucleic acid-binding protein
MGSITTYFFDTYTFYEIIEGNDNYKPYSKGIAIITTKLNLMELHYGLLLSYGKETANKYYDEFVPFCVDIDDTTIKMANEFRASFKKRHLSYVDCLGYVIAKLRNIKFLTGDQQFSDLDNVEFVK